MQKFSLGNLADPRKFNENIRINKRFKNRYLRALKTMLLIRRTEEVIGENIESGLIKCPCHLSIGQEAIPVGVSEFLTPKDFVFGNHRSHGHYIAQGGDIHGLLAEILGRVTGCSKGMGGSMHITAPENGFIGSVPIVSGTIPVAVGAALSSKMKGLNSVSISYFGDGTTEEGTFHECLNMASLYKLPVLFVCENNLYSSHMYITERQPSDSVARFAIAHNIPNVIVDGNNIHVLFEVFGDVVTRLRDGEGPFFVEAVTYRWRGHVGPDENIDVGLYRKKDLQIWKKRDPIQRLVEGLISDGVLKEQDFLSIKNKIERQVQSVWNKALSEPFPSANQLQSTVYYQQEL